MGVHLGGTIPTQPNGRGILGSLETDARGLGNSISQGVGGLMTGIGNALRGVFDSGSIFAPIGSAAKEIHDGQLAIRDRTDLLSPLLDYGSCFMKAQEGINLRGILPFDQQLGPMRGCEMHDKGIRLLDKGLWDIRAQITSSWYAISDNVEFRVIVKSPNGQIFSEQRANHFSRGNTTLVIVSSVVVPERNYLVQVELTDINTGRGLLGGPAWTRLTVQHITRNTDIGMNGSEQSDTQTKPPAEEQP